MKKIVLLMVVVMLTGLLIACGDKENNNNSGGSVTPSQAEPQHSEQPGNADDSPDGFNVGDSLPEGAVIEDSVTFEVDESKGNEHRYSRESPVG